MKTAIKFLFYFILFFQTGKAISSENENSSNRAAECIAERIEVFKSAFGETEEQLNQEEYVKLFKVIWILFFFNYPRRVMDECYEILEVTAKDELQVRMESNTGNKY